MTSTMGIILTGWKKPHLKEIAEVRSAAAVPIGGKYRAIDFALSNMVNSGIHNVGVITQYSYRSLMDHLGAGKEWDLDRRRDGLFIFPPSLDNDDSGWYKGSADALYSNLTYLKRSTEKFVVIAQGNCVYKMDYTDMLRFHIEKDAEITVAYRDMSDYSQDELRMLGLVKLNEESRIIDYMEKPLHPPIKTGALGMYIMERDFLINLLEESAAHGNYDLVKDILIKKISSIRMYGYEFKGYWRGINTVSMYYRCNMELLNPELLYSLFVENGKIFTKVKDETPAKYNEEADVSNSIVADGCIIEGKVINSVLFRGVNVKRGAIVKDSILMQNSTVEENTYLENNILDKNVVISSHKHLKGERNLPIIIEKDKEI